MGRLIDAERLKAHYCWWAGGSKEMSIDEAKKTFDTIIDIQPTVDAEPVVRCKDCKFFDHSDFGKGEEYWCKHFVSTDDTAHCHKVIEDDFCAWGERKEDAETN